MYLLDPGQGLFAVADGMGGHAGGEVASALAMDALRRAVPSAPDAEFLRQPTLAGRRALLDWLGRTVDPINRAIQDRAAEDPRLRGMGCTLDVALVRGAGLFLAHVGDSRAYLLRGGTLYQLTEDHTFSQAMLAAGVLTPEQVATHPQRHVLTRALGPFPTVQVDTSYIDLTVGDVLLLCTDGLYNDVPADRIKQILGGDPEKVPAALIEAALAAGGSDNVTAVVFAVESCARGRTIVLGSEVARAALAQSSLFAAFSPSEILRVQKIAIAHEFAAGQVVIEEEAPLASFFLVIIGQFSAWRAGQRFGKGAPGDPFGELSLVPQPAAVTIRAESPLIALEFPLAEIQNLLATEPVLAAKLATAALHRLSRRLRASNELLARYRAAGLIPQNSE